MVQKVNLVWKSAAKFVLIAAISLGGVFPIWGEPSWDSERLNLEIGMQRRVEEALSKIVSRDKFIVVVRIEPWGKSTNEAGLPADTGDGYYLPGVPTRKSIDGTAEEVRNLINTLKPGTKFYRRFIRRISSTLVLDRSIEKDQVTKIRELTRQMLGLDPQRGDTLDVQTTVFQNSNLKPIDNSNIFRAQQLLQNYWFLIGLALILFCVTVFFLFIFGPFRGFLNRFVQVLPTLKPTEQNQGRFGGFGKEEMRLLPALMAQSMGMLPPPNASGGNPAQFSGSLLVENPNKTTLPFAFIREDHLANLAILLSRETPEKAAVVIGYLHPDWISRVMARLDTTMQKEVAANLATTRQLLPEQVEDIEQDLKRRLDYLVGGPERISAIYESLEPEAQRRMVDSLRETSPEIAEQLRRQTVLFEDLEKLESPALKAVLREVELDMLVWSLTGITTPLKDRILEHVSEGKAEIIREELDLKGGMPGRATFEARKKIAQIARRLEKDGQIQIPQIEESLPKTRYGTSLRSTIKLPPTLKLDEAVVLPEEPEKPEEKLDIKTRFKRFIGQESDSDEEFSDEKDQKEEESN